MLNRREFLAAGAGAAGAALASAPHFSALAALPLAQPDISLRIAPASVEIAPGTLIRTIGYNGKIPGPFLRAREGKRTTIEVHNDTDKPEIVNIGGKPTSGIMKDVLNIARFSDAEVEFVADHPGLSLFHCHMQLHMDFGFMAMVKYV
jgi:FtsP/CotA-like multicopper oxidase with cupredoxin domain